MYQEINHGGCGRLGVRPWPERDQVRLRPRLSLQRPGLRPRTRLPTWLCALAEGKQLRRVLTAEVYHDEVHDAADCDGLDPVDDALWLFPSTKTMPTPYYQLSRLPSSRRSNQHSPRRTTPHVGAVGASATRAFPSNGPGSAGS